MKLFGIPLVYIVIAVGLLGIVTYSYYSYNKPAFVADDTLKCQRTYDFSQVKFTTEAKQDWDKCYMPEPLYERKYGEVQCVYYPEESCSWCGSTLAVKYNDSTYCKLMAVCGDDKEIVQNCVKAINGESFTPLITASRVSNISEIITRVDSIYSNRRKSTR